MAGEVHCVDAMALSERADVFSPRDHGRAQAVQQEDGLPLSGLHVVDADPVDVDVPGLAG